jgi:hypothetical protein
MPTTDPTPTKKAKTMKTKITKTEAVQYLRALACDETNRGLAQQYRIIAQHLHETGKVWLAPASEWAATYEGMLHDPKRVDPMPTLPAAILVLRAL